jgi:hypothetical protein
MLKSYLVISCVISIALLTGCKTLQKSEHEPIIAVASPVKNVPIIVSYQGSAFYHVQVNNTLPNTINLLWDESTYVTTTGKSVRILHLQSKHDIPTYPPAQQAPSPISPNSQFQADFTGEDWLDCARRNCTPQPQNSLKNAEIYLTFNIKGKRVRWQGEISFAPSRQP